MCGGLRGPMDRVQSVSSSKALVIRARTIEALAGGSPGQGAPALSDRLRFLRVVPDEADQECEDHAADRAAADVPDPALDRLSVPMSWPTMPPPIAPAIALPSAPTE